MIFIILLFFLFFPHFVLAETPVVKITGFSEETDPEWVELTNNQSEPINLTNWYFKDAKENKRNIGNTTIPANEKIKLEYSKGWLNDDEDTIYLYDSTDKQIDSLAYTEPTKVPTPTKIPTQTPTPTNTPTPDPTITNPPSGVSLTEFMAYSDPEWIEIHNNNDFPIKLVSWKIEDLNGNVKNIDSLSISAKGYSIYELKSLIFDNNSDEKIFLRDQDNKIISQVFYGKGQLTLDRSWSYISGSWCQASITKGYVNVTSCYAAPTSNVLTPTATPTSDPTKFSTDDIASESAIIEPKSESSFITPESSAEPSPTITSNLVLGDSTSSAATPKKNYLPLILIILGGSLLISPTILAKIKHKK